MKRLYSTVKTLNHSSISVPANSTVFSLIQPTGKIHLGNYLGAIRTWTDILACESNSKIIFGLADLHSITLPYNPEELRENRYGAIASLIACGVDPEKCILYQQSSVREHTELNWILTCLTSMGALNRMTQWKLKASVDGESSIFDEEILGRTKAGLLCYPVLQAADILLYKSTHVPVGDDQSQHLELCRNIASSFNHTYRTDFFPVPNTILTPTKKISALRNPAKKMSKSDRDQKSSVYLTDSEDEIKAKIKKATTDSVQGPVYFDMVERPGVSNLINIVLGITRKLVEETVDDMKWIKDHRQLKEHVTEVIVEEFRDKREKYQEIIGDRKYLDDVVALGRDRAREIASRNMKEVRKITGLD